MEEVKTFQPNITLHLPTLFQLYYPGSLDNMNTTQQIEVILVAKQTIDDEQTLSISWIDITETNMK